MGFARKDSVLRSQVLNFSATLAADPAVYHQTPETATAVTTAVDAYVDALDILTVARDNGVRSQQQTITKDDRRREMLQLLMPIYRFVQQSAAISDTAKAALGVHIVDTHRTPQPVPGFAPLMTVLKTDGRIFTLRMANPNEPDAKRRPLYTAGISVFSYVGDTPPMHATDFKFEGVTGHTTISVEIPPTVPVGSTVYFTCFYFNNRKESGPAATPISATVGAGSTMPMLKIAA